MGDIAKSFYTMGFLFSHYRTHLALIHKLKPKWQAGRINGIGGKLEENENYRDCMRREFKEETGVDITTWQQFCELRGDWGMVMCYKAFDDAIFQVKTMEQEQIEIFPVGLLPYSEMIPNLRWLIPLALDKDSISVIAQEHA